MTREHTTKINVNTRYSMLNNMCAYSLSCIERLYIFICNFSVSDIKTFSLSILNNVCILYNFVKNIDRKYIIKNWWKIILIILLCVFILYIGFYTNLIKYIIGLTIFILNCIYNAILFLFKLFCKLVVDFFYGFCFFLKDVFYTYLITDFSLFYFILFFFNVFLSFFFLNYLGYRGVFCYNLFFLSLVVINFLSNFYHIIFNNNTYKYNFGFWFITTNNIKINFSLLVDQISFSFAFLTIIIAFFVYIYSFSYFRYEPLVDRFMLFLSVFLSSMVLFVLSGNLILLFLGWELIGISSFLLINFWSTKISTLKSAFKAFVFNKVSDMFMFIFILLLYNIFLTLDITILNSQIYVLDNTMIYIFNYKINFIEFLCLILLVPASIKSAQFGAHIWLPDSMEAPVPASALIHSATLVSAGVFLLLRFSVFFEYTYVCNLLIPFLGALTAFTGSFLACFQSDIKKILAYSTISHCGFLFYLVNTSVIEFTLFYLFAHGFFKAASFMCIGNVLRFSKGYQDFRRMGGFWKYLPFEYFFTFICLANLAGLPFTLGFFSKHLVLYSVEYSTFYFYINYYFINISSILGLLYSFRLFWFTFLDFKKGRKSIYKLNNNESLFSKYYTNSSLASIIAITSLVTLSYVILILFYIELVKNNYLTMDVNLNINNINYNHVIKQDMVKQLNLSFVNFFLFFIFFFFFYIDWRKTYYYKSKIVTFFEFVIIITCLFFFKTFL